MNRARKVSAVIRIVLTALVLVGVYSETGKWTVTVLALICAALELLSYSLIRLIRDIERHLEGC